MKNIKEFEVYVPQSKIDLLHEKIALSRWPDELNDNKWSLGTSLDYLKKATHAWVNDFSWRDHEALINNAGSHMFHSSSGLDIHFLQINCISCQLEAIFESPAFLLLRLMED